MSTTKTFSATIKSVAAVPRSKRLRQAGKATASAASASAAPSGDWLPRAEFDELFAKVEQGGGYAIEAKLGLYSLSYVSALGRNSASGEGGTGGAAYLYELGDAAVSEPAAGDLLRYNGAAWANTPASTILAGYATEAWVEQQGYATQAWVQEQGYGSGSGSGVSVMVVDSIGANGVVSVTQSGNIINVTRGKFLTSHQSLANYVTLDSKQTITAAKTFSAGLSASELGVSGDAGVHGNFWAGGDVLLGPTTIEGSLDVDLGITCESLRASGHVTALSSSSASDERLKEIEGDLALSVEDIAAAPSIRFRWRDCLSLKRAKTMLGTIAQYWRKVAPEAVHRDISGTLSLEYGPLALCSAISLARRVVELEKRIKSLEKWRS